MTWYYVTDIKNMAMHKTHANVSWPGPKQWLMTHTFELLMVIRWIQIPLQSPNQKSEIGNTGHAPKTPKTVTQSMGTYSLQSLIKGNYNEPDRKNLPVVHGWRQRLNAVHFNNYFHELTVCTLHSNTFQGNDYCLNFSIAECILYSMSISILIKNVSYI